MTTVTDPKYPPRAYWGPCAWLASGVIIGRSTARYQQEAVRVLDLAPEDTVVDVPRRRVHVITNAGEGETRFRLEVRPARRMETLMRAVSAASRAGAPSLTPLNRGPHGVIWGVTTIAGRSGPGANGDQRS